MRGGSRRYPAIPVESSRATGLGGDGAAAPDLRIFDKRQRDDAYPAREGEDSFSFLNRVDTPFWAQVRELLEDFFSRYPSEHAESLRRDFRSRLPGRHFAAWWELYLHELFGRLGYDIIIHPALEGTERRPDFGLSREGAEVLVEASVVFSGIAGSEEEMGAAPGWMLAAFEGIENPNFFVSIHEVASHGEEQLKRAEIARPVEEWLVELDPDQVSREYEEDGRFPSLRVERRGWAVDLEAWPVKAEARGRPGHRVLGSGPAMGAMVDDVDQLESKLKAKAGRYGRPKVPFVIAVLSLSSFMERLDIVQALFGREAVVISGPGEQGRLVRQRNGFWVRGEGPINRRVSAVLMGVGIQPWNLLGAAPELWENPWAENPVEDEWPFALHSARESGEILYGEGGSDLAEMFGLPGDWPEGRPFPRE
jgi:hypothetical protein